MRWIAVNEGLKPKEREVVVVRHRRYDGRLKPAVYTARWWSDEENGRGGTWSEVTSTCGCCQSFDSDKVTHWARLPEIEGSFMSDDDYFTEISKKDGTTSNQD